jgi:hypothetical protein
MKKLEQKEIELVQSYLTQEEAKVIIPEYIENFRPAFREENSRYDTNKELLYASPSQCLNDAFNWGNTPQGHDYWYRIYGLLRQRYYDGI